jgi:hypothetical protein
MEHPKSAETELYQASPNKRRVTSSSYLDPNSHIHDMDYTARILRALYENIDVFRCEIPKAHPALVAISKLMIRYIPGLKI